MTEKEIQKRKQKLFSFEHGNVRVEEQYDEHYQTHGVFMVSFGENFLEGLTAKDLFNLMLGTKAAHQHAVDNNLEPTNWPCRPLPDLPPDHI